MDRRWPISRALDLTPGLLGIGVFAVWSRLEGGFEPTAWYPGALFLLGALLATGWGLRARLTELPRLTQLAAGLLASFTLWSYLSITWADVPAEAWDGANRTLLYLLAFGLFALPRWRAGAAATVFGLYSVALAAVAVITLLDLLGTADPATFFIDGRLIEPTGYQNSTAALLIGGIWPALLLSSRRETPWPLRGVLLAITGLLLQLALLPQSRGAALVLPLALLLYFALVPSRLRSLAVVVPVAVGTLLTAPRLLDVYDAVQAGEGIDAALDRAAGAIGLCCLALFVVGTALAFVDSRARLPAPIRRIAARAALALACVAAIGGLGAGLAATGDPVEWAEQRFDDFKGGYDDSFEVNRFSGDLGSNRYDFWRVGLGTTFAGSPVIGAGADNFAVDYMRERRSDEEPHYPHSLPVRVLAGTGLIGGLLLGGFLIASVAGAFSRARQRPPDLGRAVGAAGIVAASYWFMHSAGDWLWSFPAVTAPAFAWLAMAGTLAPATGGRVGAPIAAERERPAPADAGAGPGRRPRWPQLSRSPLPLSILGGICLVLILGSLLGPWLSARYVESAAGGWQGDPDRSYAQLERAQSLNPLSARPDLVAGAIAARYEDLPRMTDYFEAALEREPDNWYALLELGVASAVEGDRPAAISLLEQAQSLNPLDPLIRETARRVEAGRAVSLTRIDQALLGRVCERIGRAANTGSCSR